MGYRKPYFSIVDECNCAFDGEPCMNVDGCFTCQRRMVADEEADEDFLP